ncbi:MAG: phosphoglycerate kinase [Synergistales bacterium]
MKLKGLPEKGLKGKRVLVRVDFNVPLREGVVADDMRILSHLETIRRLLEAGAGITLVSHLGRPKGKVSPEFSLKPVTYRFAELTGWDVGFVEECIGPVVEDAVSAVRPGTILVLENVRFHPEEEKNDPDFACALAKPFDAFVMDAFSASHRAHASTQGITAFLPSYAGNLLCREVEILGQVRDHPRRPFSLILGGAKVSDKIGVIGHLLDKVDTILVGGGMAFTFLKAQGLNVGRSMVEQDRIAFAGELLVQAAARNIEILLPTDIVAADSPASGGPVQTVPAETIPEHLMGLDIGPESAEVFSKVIERSSTVFWNGPMGVFENPLFADGTRTISQSLAEATKSGCLTVVGGGDTAAAVNGMGFAGKVSHVSTGGGASLEFFEGLSLPGIQPFVLD